VVDDRRAFDLADVRDQDGMIARIDAAAARFEMGGPVPRDVASLFALLARALQDSGPAELGVER
jgi:hypothetical protein